MAIKLLGYTLNQQVKALVGGGIAFVGSLTTALADKELTLIEVLTVVGATLAAYAGVFGSNNAGSARKRH